MTGFAVFRRHNVFAHGTSFVLPASASGGCHTNCWFAGVLYQLYYIDDDGTFQVCPGCGDAMTANLEGDIKPIPFSLAEVDYGRLPVELPSLSTIEKCVIARVRVFRRVVKLRGGANSLCGHVVCFAHDAPLRVVSLPNLESTSFSVVYMKAPGKSAPTDMANYDILRCNRDIVMTWLCFLKRFNPSYADIVIDESNDRWEAVVRVATDISVVEDGEAVAIDERIASNIAGGDHAAVIEPVLITERPRQPHSSDADVLGAVSGLVNRRHTRADVDPITDDHPVNEFEGNGRMVMEAFPHLFPLGSGHHQTQCPGNIRVGERWEH